MPYTTKPAPERISALLNEQTALALRLHAARMRRPIGRVLEDAVKAYLAANESA